MSTQMTGEAQEGSVVPLRMPRADGLPPPAPDDGRNPLFGLLVRSDADLTGLLAYALYKQNKRNWLRAFEEVMGRLPTGEETQAFILGERLPARVEAYRRLAEERLTQEVSTRRDSVQPARLKPESTANETGATATTAAPTAAEAIRRISWRQLGLLLLLVVGMAGVFRVLGAWLFRP